MPSRQRFLPWWRSTGWRSTLRGWRSRSRRSRGSCRGKLPRSSAVNWHFGSYNRTYGSLGAVVVLLMWLYVSSLAVLLGAEIDGEIEKQAARERAAGLPQPTDRRGA
ncbi:MAG: YhjD/YihY/BrkB family envelope integrity protein [Steroidobacteraceae bacterium]